MMLTVYEETEMIFKALTAGATGYLLKQTPPSELLQAIRDVHRGGSPMTSHIARKIVASFQQPVVPVKGMENLTAREQEVLDLLAKGFLYKEIAEALGISYDTVHAHIRRIYEKLQVRSRTEAVAKRLNQGGSIPHSHVGAH
jgi:DNA-binding NarL/FixJ family response regulator